MHTCPARTFRRTASRMTRYLYPPLVCNLNTICLFVGSCRGFHSAVEGGEITGEDKATLELVRYGFRTGCMRAVQGHGSSGHNTSALTEEITLLWVVLLLVTNEKIPFHLIASDEYCNACSARRLLTGRDLSQYDWYVTALALRGSKQLLLAN